MAGIFMKTLLSALALASAVIAGNVTFNGSNRFLFDVEGNHISAYALKIYYFEKKYYAYGLDFTVALGLNEPLICYSSVDLVNWKSEGVLSTTNGGRPHVIYNPTTQKYVLWSGGYRIATSPAPNTPFTDVGTAALDPQFAGLQGADASVSTIGDKAYLTWAVLNFNDPRAGSLWPPIFQTMHISPLTDDFLNTTQTSTPVTSTAFDLVDQQTESPDLFVRNGIYYVVVSNTCGFCSGSIAAVCRSVSIAGPWARDIISGYSCGGQVEGVLPLVDPVTKETSYVWHATTTPGGPRISFSGHVFQPLRFNADGSVQDLDCRAEAEYTTPLTLGEGAPDTGALTEATDGSPRFADYQPVCDTDLFARVIQTWTNTKTGVLSSVAVNLAAGNQTTTVGVVVFRFSNLTDLLGLSPYKFETLASATFTSAQIGTSFRAMHVALNTTVAAGDQLGFYIAEGAATPSRGSIITGLLPYCHLEYNVGPGDRNGPGQLLFQQGAGQYSLRGMQMNMSPVQERRGKGVKFFATVR